MILSFPGEELDVLFMNTLFILPGVIAERSKDIIFSGSGDGITLSIHRTRPGFSGVLYRELAPMVMVAKWV